MSEQSPFKPISLAYESKALQEVHPALRQSDREHIRSCKQKMLAASLATLKAQSTALQRAHLKNYVTESEFEDARAEVAQEFTLVSKLLLRRVDPVQMKLMWASADKTSYHDKIYEMLRDVLSSSILEIGSGDGRKKKQVGTNALRASMLEHYDAKRNRSDSLIWCPVMQDAFSAGERVGRKMAHIIPVKFGEQNICALLGHEPDSKPMNAPSNLLFLDSVVEQYFDQGKITFIPIRSSNSSASDQPIEYKVAVVDQSILKLRPRQHMTWLDLDGKPLKFRNSNRPGKRNLYLHNILAYLRAQVCQWAGFEDVRDRLFAGHYSSATPDAFVRSDMLHWLAETVAGDLPPDWYECYDPDLHSPSEFQPSPAYLERRAVDLARRFTERDHREAIDINSLLEDVYCVEYYRRSAYDDMPETSSESSEESEWNDDTGPFV